MAPVMVTSIVNFILNFKRVNLLVVPNKEIRLL